MACGIGGSDGQGLPTSADAAGATDPGDSSVFDTAGMKMTKAIKKQYRIEALLLASVHRVRFFSVQ
jgi:hypothetical protein